MTIHKRIELFFDHKITRWILIVLLLFAFSISVFFTPVPSDYSYSHTETVKIISVRPLETSFGTTRVLVSFEREDGRVDSMALPVESTPDKGQFINIDVLQRSKKKNRYRLAQPAPTP